MSMIRPIPFCPSLLPWKNDTPVPPEGQKPLPPTIRGVLILTCVQTGRPWPNVLDVPARPTFSVEVATSVAGIELTDKPKVWFAAGPGRSGKTMLLRWEVTASRGGAAIVAAPIRRTEA